MQAMRVNQPGREPALVAADVPQPSPGDGEVLIRVRAAGVTPPELHWYPTTFTRQGSPRTDAIPGHEFSGTIAALGGNVSGVSVGEEVYGMNDWFADGASAEYCLTQPAWIATKPASLTHQAAASVPISALTAWQGLFHRARIHAGDRVLVHGGAGAVGLFAVQLAHRSGARVIATASGRGIDFVKSLGANEAIDYRKSRFEDAMDPVDAVFDTVGGETLERSWGLLKPGGRMVTVASESGAASEQRVKDAFFIVEPSRKQLTEVARSIDAGELQTFVKATVPFADASAAYSGTVPANGGFGKLVLSVSAQ